MTVKITLRDGTKVECDTPEEASRLLAATGKPKCSKADACYQPWEDSGSHCDACGNHHYGMC